MSTHRIYSPGSTRTIRGDGGTKLADVPTDGQRQGTRRRPTAKGVGSRGSSYGFGVPSPCPTTE
jgi:hypothetical protein